MYNKSNIERIKINTIERNNLNNNKLNQKQTKIVLKDTTPFNPPLPKFENLSSKIGVGVEDIIAHIMTKKAIKKANKIAEKNNDDRQM